MPTTIYTVSIVGEVAIEIDDSVIEMALTDEWQSECYRPLNAQDIAAHIAYCQVINGAELSDIDGFEDLSDDLADVVDEGIYFE